MAAEIGRFYTDLLPYLRAVNIIVFSINHIRVKTEIGIVKTASELLYLDQNETTPGGKGPQYLAHILLKSIAQGSEKYTEEDNGFSGFGLKLKVIKARSNSAGKMIDVVYDNVRGVDSIRSCIAFAKENGLIGGNKNAMYFINNKDLKFPYTTCTEYFHDHPEMYKVMYDHIIPVLEGKLSSIRGEEIELDDALLDY